MATLTPTQGRYLSYIHAYTNLHGYPPGESEIAAALCVSPPSVNLMVKTLERRGLISRQPGTPRSIRVLLPESEIPSWRTGRASGSGSAATADSARGVGRASATSTASPPANLYVLHVFLVGGPTSPQFANKEISRVIEIRGDQTLEQLHEAIFQAYDRWDQHLYEFQFGRRPFDPEGPKYSIPDRDGPANSGDARTTTLDSLGLNTERVFGYWFDFGDDWFHQIQVNKIDKAIPTVTYPRVTRRVGKSPPQYAEGDDEAGDDAGHAKRRPHKRKRSLRTT